MIAKEAWLMVYENGVSIPTLGTVLSSDFMECWKLFIQR